LGAIRNGDIILQKQWECGINDEPESCSNSNLALTKMQGICTMANKPDITPSLLRQLLRYDPETGALYWRSRTRDMFCSSTQSNIIPFKTWNKRFAGNEAFTALTQGYKHGNVLGKKFRAHRVIWAMQTGDDVPENMEIDHVNGVRSDNRWVNLRLATRRQNMWNVKGARSDSLTAVKGVSYRAERKRYVAKIKIDGKCKKIGSFKTIEEAEACYNRAVLDYRGEFASCQY
jgi:hypothetical protein